MTAVTADRFTARRQGEAARYGLAASETTYKGTLVVLSSGYLEDGTDKASALFAGVAEENVDNSAGSNGDLDCLVCQKGRFRFAHAGSPAVTDIGTALYLVDNQTVADAGTTTNDVYVGTLAAIDDNGEVWVDIQPFAQHLL